MAVAGNRRYWGRLRKKSGDTVQAVAGNPGDRSTGDRKEKALLDERLIDLSASLADLS